MGPVVRLLAAPAAFALLLPALAPSLPLLIIGACLLGALSGAIDIAMNAHGIAIENHMRRPIVSRLHAYFSLGGLLGAGAAALVLPLASSAAHVVAVTVVLLVLSVPIIRGVLPGDLDSRAGTPGFVLPSRAALGIGLMAFVALMSEGAIVDWSAVYLLEHLSSGEGVAALGFAAFSATMTVGRFLGDRLRARLTEVRLLVASSAVSAAGLATGLLFPSPTSAIVGFGIMGFGMANMVPLLFVASARVPGLAPSIGLATVTTVGYAGFVAGPVVIGGLAEIAGLRAALATIVLGIVAIALVTPRYMRSAPSRVAR